jgi:integrase
VIIKRRIEYAKGGWLFSSTRGRVKIRPQTTGAAVDKIAAAMLADSTARADFQMRDIRRTCETLLAGMGANKDLRAQLQSHGLGGVQQRHYDKHDYMVEKRSALTAWENRLFQAGASSNVLQLKAA